MKKENMLKTRKTATLFGIAALVGGFLFLNRSITGNIILNNENSFNLVSLMGMLLIVCSVILGAYALKKK